MENPLVDSVLLSSESEGDGIVLLCNSLIWLFVVCILRAILV